MRSKVAALIVVVSCLAACGTSSSRESHAESPKWDANATKVVASITTRLQRAFPRECANAGPLPRDVIVPQLRRLGLPAPLVIDDCDLFGSTAEITALKDKATRSAWIAKRAGILCTRATTAKAVLPGFHYAVNDGIAIQVESEGLAKRVAAALEFRYQLLSCPGHSAINWEPKAEQRIEAIAQRLSTDATIECSGFQLLDRSQYARDPAYRGGLPAAYGRCEGRGNAAVYIASFSPSSASRDAFLARATADFCRSGTSTAEAHGDDWAIVATPKVAQRTAALLGGSARTAC